MTTETILKPISDCQIDIPQEWIKIMWIDKKQVKARFEWTRIVIELLEENEKIDWDTKLIELNKLNNETIEAIKESEKNYKAWKRDLFLSHKEFWNDL